MTFEITKTNRSSKLTLEQAKEIVKPFGEHYVTWLNSAPKNQPIYIGFRTTIKRIS